MTKKNNINKKKNLEEFKSPYTKINDSIDGIEDSLVLTFF